MAIKSVSDGGTRLQSISTQDTTPQEGSIQSKPEPDAQEILSKDVFEECLKHSSFERMFTESKDGNMHSLKTESQVAQDFGQNIQLTSQEEMALKMRYSSQDAISIRRSTEENKNAITRSAVRDPNLSKMIKDSELEAVEGKQGVNELKPTEQALQNALLNTPESEAELRQMVKVLEWILRQEPRLSDHPLGNLQTPLGQAEIFLMAINDNIDSEGFSEDILMIFKNAQARINVAVGEKYL